MKKVRRRPFVVSRPRLERGLRRLTGELPGGSHRYLDGSLPDFPRPSTTNLDKYYTPTDAEGNVELGEGWFEEHALPAEATVVVTRELFEAWLANDTMQCATSLRKWLAGEAAAGHKAGTRVWDIVRREIAAHFKAVHEDDGEVHLAAHARGSSQIESAWLAELMQAKGLFDGVGGGGEPEEEGAAAILADEIEVTRLLAVPEEPDRDCGEMAGEEDGGGGTEAGRAAHIDGVLGALGLGGNADGDGGRAGGGADDAASDRSLSKRTGV